MGNAAAVEQLRADGVLGPAEGGAGDDRRGGARAANPAAPHQPATAAAAADPAREPLKSTAAPSSSKKRTKLFNALGKGVSALGKGISKGVRLVGSGVSRVTGRRRSGATRTRSVNRLRALSNAGLLSGPSEDDITVLRSSFYVVSVTVCQARGVRHGRASKVFARVTVGGETRATPAVRGRVPAWNASLTFAQRNAPDRVHVSLHTSRLLGVSKHRVGDLDVQLRDFPDGGQWMWCAVEPPAEGAGVEEEDEEEDDHAEEEDEVEDDDEEEEDVDDGSEGPELYLHIEVRKHSQADHLAELDFSHALVVTAAGSRGLPPGESATVELSYGMQRFRSAAVPAGAAWNQTCSFFAWPDTTDDDYQLGVSVSAAAATGRRRERPLGQAFLSVHDLVGARSDGGCAGAAADDDNNEVHGDEQPPQQGGDDEASVVSVAVAVPPSSAADEEKEEGVLQPVAVRAFAPSPAPSPPASAPASPAPRDGHRKIAVWVPLSASSGVLQDRDLATRGAAAAADDDASAGPAVKLVVESVPRHAIEDELIAQMLRDFDANGDGLLELEEFMLVLASLGSEVSEDAVCGSFAAVAEREGSVGASGTGLGPRGILDLFLVLSYNSPRLSILLFNALHAHVGAGGGAPMTRFGARPEDPLRHGMAAPAARAAAGDAPLQRRYITVMERRSGVVVRENVPRYIRVALKAMYGSRGSRMLSRRSAGLLALMSRRQGRKYDDPASAADIPAFVELHAIDTSEVDAPAGGFRTFNDFFARGLVPGARPVDPDPRALLSSADCRLMVFEHVTAATRLWVKGQRFTVENLLGPDAAPRLAERLSGGSICIARLAPQDYHRWHCPVSAAVGPVDEVPGILYSVNPVAVTHPVDVFTENKRVVCQLDSDHHGSVALVAVGATMVGSIHLTAEAAAVGSRIERGAGHGEFRFGGSTVILLFERGAVEFDADLLRNSRRQIETIVRCNSRIGVAASSE